MIRLLAIVAAIWLLLLPPVFTNGECSAELEGLSNEFEHQPRLVSTPNAARALFAERGVPVSVISADDCRRGKPRFLRSCGSGPLIQAEVPVRNRICRIYRDDTIEVQLHYDDRNRLQRFALDMAPYRSLPLPWGGAIHWGR
ncbi:hypothetical protein HLB44_15340 [Aquincola sp. S2]|uniref:DUF3019 domain-containing protein n=1 Tax=Pseudaquabacterium terrae TaxID=2732868 RepID=A0ABX2EIA8_9BURK|nr:hypothetical protein [Aquabacterium terrae]NRF68367.1 hypothetical protein [Aquabacterium terrae]